MQYGTAIIAGSYGTVADALGEYASAVAPSGSVFVLFRTEYGANGDVAKDFMDVIRAGADCGLTYVNTVVVPVKEPVVSGVPDNVLYIVWFSKDYASLFFNKDAIREPHIWKDVEWGHREKNYNPKGKDPGNVWIPTEDDGKGHIVRHILLDRAAVVDRLRACTAQSGLQEILISDDPEDESLCSGGMLFEHKPALKTGICSDDVFIAPVPVHHENGGRLSGTVIFGSSEDMSAIPAHSVKVVITSPPYWDLKDYFKKGQIGQEPYPEYLERMRTVWKNCYEKLSDDGSLWLNINIRVKNGRVILIPKDFIEQCTETGFHYKGILIWHKSSGIPTHDRNIVDRHEYVLIFSKKTDFSVSDAMRKFADYKNTDINGGLFWNINRKAGSVGKHYIHPAIYPDELVRRIVECVTEEGDTVLDPFLGSGTTLIASVLERRNCIGYEYNEGFEDLILGRVQSEVGMMPDFDLTLKHF